VRLLPISIRPPQTLLTHIMFVNTTAALASSVQAFMDAPEYWRDAMGNNPKYFLHIDSKQGPLFGLSKFCAFSNITLQDYVVSQRHNTGGGTTQKLISKISGKDWMPLATTDSGIRKKFEQWFSGIVGNKISRDNINIIVLDDVPTKTEKSKRAISPEDLQKRLKRQNEIGKVGELIALEYEIGRLNALGAKVAKNLVEHVALVNAAAGFDIRSCFAKVTRYIEVKSSTVIDGAFYISPNEINTLQKHGASGFIYLVHITDLIQRTGNVIREVSNPFPEGENAESLSVALYRAKLP